MISEAPAPHRRLLQGVVAGPEPGPEITTLPPMETRPPPDPVKLLASWMEWEKGETPPGKVISNLKLGGMKELLEMAAEQARLAAELESY